MSSHKPFEGFPTDLVELHKPNGDVIRNVEVIVRPPVIYAQDTSLGFQEEDQIHRFLSNGITEQYEVIQAEFVRDIDNTSSHYKLLVRKVRPSELLRSTSRPDQSSGAAIGTSEQQVLIFISHSSKDKELAERYTQLLRAALRLSARSIRCTSVEGHRLRGGARTDTELKREIREAPIFVGIVSPKSMRSVYVLLELGARWGADLEFIPLLAYGVSDDELAALRGINALALDNPADLHQHLREVADTLGIPLEPADAYQKQLDHVLATPHSAESTGLNDVNHVGSGVRRDLDLLKGLTPDAIELLRAAAIDPAGGALVVDTRLGLAISAAGHIFTNDTARSQARWSAALDELIKRDLLRRDGALCSPTANGFKAVDLLQEND